MATLSWQCLSKSIRKVAVGTVAFLWSFWSLQSAAAISLAQTPLFLGNSAKPTLVLAMSRDQELFYSAYPDYSNLDGGLLSMADTTYRNNFKYYGYFNSNWCYDYVADATTKNSYFNPSVATTNHKCDGSKWSGNFLNWSTMTRIDVLRKVLFGGKRSVDTAKTASSVAQTILERSFVPKDSHAFSKVFVGSSEKGSVSDYTPYKNSSITLCNVSTESSDVNGYPVVRVAAGEWAEWSHTEKTECQWRENVSGRTTSPGVATKLAEAVAKVKVCVPGKDVTNNIYNPSDKNQSAGCYSYEENSYKPIGVLQKKYKDINFGLVMGTWGRNDQGGVLRRTAGKLAGNTVPSGTDRLNEFSEATGVFNNNVTYGIIKDINLLKIVGYPFTTVASDVSYINSTDWRNPISEIYAEALRYITGKKAGTLTFDADDSLTIPGLTRVALNAWDDPLDATSWCSQCSILLISSGPNSFDNDAFTDPFLKTIGPTEAPLTKKVLNDTTDSIGTNEFKSRVNTLSVGGTNATKQCAAEPVAFSGLLGLCPEAPMSQGSYTVAGLAYWAHTIDQRSAYAGDQTVRTYAVELSEGLPKFNLLLGDSNSNVNIVPVCMNGPVGAAVQAACSLVGARVENIKYDIDDVKDPNYSKRKPISGSYLFYWEDQRWGSDYDLDAVQRIEFCIGVACGKNSKGDYVATSDQLMITNTLPYWATGTSGMSMGYNISGASNLDPAIVDVNKRTGLQETLYVQRNGYDNHNLKDQNGKAIKTKTDAPDQWYNTLTIPTTDADPLPVNSGTKIYKSVGKFATTNDDKVAKKIETPLFYAAKYGNFEDGNGNKIPDDKVGDIASEWDQTNLAGDRLSDGLPDNYFMMKNPALLEAALISMLSKVGNRSASGSGVSTNSTQQLDDIFIYQALFNSKDWSGEVKALYYSNKSNADYVDKWTTRGKITNPGTRKIFSHNPDTKSGFEFNESAYATMTSAQQSALGSTEVIAKEIINWTRGTSVTGYRKRTELMGDIVNSTPVYVGPASLGYDKLDAAYNSASYAEFVSKEKATRKKAIYVGSNDGMLHAIDADDGSELFAYVPSMVYSTLKTIALPTYVSNHRYSVDGPIAVGDAYVNGKWRTILVGTLGAGGRGIFVLDVTNPASFNTTNVLFEIDANTLPSIGNVMGKPYIAPVSGKWQIVLANGYSSSAGNVDKAELIVVDLENATSKVITTNNSTGNGLSAATLLQNPSTGAVEYAYAGDLQGNMWKFNLVGNSSGWGVANSGAPLFVAKDSATPANPQPIVSAPTLGRNAKKSNAVMVYFGTGKYIESGDVTSSNVQSFYGIADEGSAVTYGTKREDVLHKKTMTVNAANTLRDVNDSGETTIDTDWTKYKGWYLDFPAGERIVSKSLLLYDRLIFSTLIPKTSDCSFGGSGWLMELVGVGDVFGTKHELLPNNGEILEFFLPGELIAVKGGKVLQKCSIAGTCGDEELNIPPLDAEGGGRMSWRQLR